MGSSNTKAAEVKKNPVAPGPTSEATQLKLNLSLYEAVHYGHCELVLDLITRGALPCEQECNSDPSKKEDVFTAATKRASRASDFDLEQMSKRVLAVVKQAFDACSPSIFPQAVQAVIEQYCDFGRLDCLRLLYQCGLQPLPSVTSALFDALAAGDSEAVEVMLRHEGPALMRKKAPDGYGPQVLTPLQHCVRSSFYFKKAEAGWCDPPRCIRLLLEAKADVNDEGVLDSAYYHYQHEVAVLLIQAGANKFSRDMNPLWFILSNSHLDEEQGIVAVELLRQNNLLKPEYHNFAGRGQNPMCAPRYVPPTAVEYAEAEGNAKLAALLKELR